MIIPCIDLQGRKVVQLVQGRDKALEGGSPQEMLDKFAAFPVIQVIDLDAAIGTGANEDIVEWIAARARIRVGGGVRTPEKACRLVDLGVEKVIVGTAAFGPKGPNVDFLKDLNASVTPEKILLALDSKNGRIVVKGPLPSGPTSVQFGYRLPSETGQVTIAQPLPVGGPMSSVIVRRHAGTTVTVAGERQRRDTQLEGRDYLMVGTGAIQPSAPLQVTISGMPSRPRWPLRVALTLAGLIVLAGVVFGRARADDDSTAPASARS